nr:hypothetical protein [Candidatus Electrothrix aestuarii]
MGFLMDTNVLSELRKDKKADRNVREWFAQVDGVLNVPAWLSLIRLKVKKQKVRQKKGNNRG